MSLLTCDASVWPVPSKSDLSSLAILVRHSGATPLAVRLEAGDDALGLVSAHQADSVPWWRLYRLETGDFLHRFGRLDKRGWGLRVSGGADQALLAHIKSRPLAALARPFHGLHLAKLVLGIIVLGATFAEAIPARWVASALPKGASERLVSGYIKSNARQRCGHEGGEEAIRKILVRLDPELGPSIDIVGINQGGFMVTALPPRKLLLFRDTLTAVDADAVAALLAHELSHIRHGDAAAAVVRHEGNVATMFALLEGEDRRRALLQFSGEEEDRADHEAIDSMKRAGLPLSSAARMFEQMRVASYENSGFAAEQRDFHFGFDNRARRWAVAAQSDPPGQKPAAEGSDADNLYNFCWVGPLRLAKPGRSAELPDVPPMEPGSAALSNN